MNNEHFEELASLHALGLLDEPSQAELLKALDQDPAVQRLLCDFEETAAALALEAPQLPPPPALKKEILSQLPGSRSNSKIIRFPSWIPYAIAACLMIVTLAEAARIFALKSQIESQTMEMTELNEAFNLIQLHLATLDAKDPSYQSSRIIVAWDPFQHHGTISMQNLPEPPVGHNYQLWVLDPGALTPISAGIIHADKASGSFTVKTLTTSNPGFAITLEPGEGSPEPTTPILFAVAPGQ